MKNRKNHIKEVRFFWKVGLVLVEGEKTDENIDASFDIQLVILSYTIFYFNQEQTTEAKNLLNFSKSFSQA